MNEKSRDLEDEDETEDMVECDNCEGTGYDPESEDDEDCPVCGGSGMVEE